MDQTPIRPASYDGDLAAWADEQAALIRAGRFERLDLEHIAEEIESVGISERREITSRLAVLLTHLLKWQHQPDRRGASWDRTLREQRKRIERRLQKMPSLRPMLTDPDWIDEAWGDAVTAAVAETGIELAAFPEVCPWPLQDALCEGWTPGAA
ncbi:DUF29 domain-containing protein [Lichenicoccus sp.]|uniref:DUF29 domain-containing protein n=1 Tax=Lichenicoccus sp. TaxID=2781899 RepID=UPI003D0F6E28